MKQLLKRFVSMVLLIAFAVWLFWYTNPQQFELFTAMVMILVAYEWAVITQVRMRWQVLFTIVFFAWLFVLLEFPSYAVVWIYAGISAFSLITLAILLFNFQCVKKQFERSWLVRLLGVVLFSASWLAVVHVHEQYGPEILLIGFLPVWLMDTGAYVFGKWLGKTPFSPMISPNKTWGGFWGGLLAAMIITPLVAYYWLHWDWRAATGIAFVMALASVIGDLFESAVKRVAQIKDSGVLVPGHGGVLDRLDSVLATMVIYCLLLGIFNIH